MNIEIGCIYTLWSCGQN